MNLKRTLQLAVILIIGFSFSACNDKNYYYYEGAFVDTHFFIIGEADESVGEWRFDEEAGRYYCEVRFPDLDKDMYDLGAIQAAVFINERINNTTTRETLNALPFVRSYYDTDNDITFTETISCEIYYGNPSRITFYIQADNFIPYDLSQDYFEFKVNVVYEP